MKDTNFSNLPAWLPRQLKRTQLSCEQLAHRAGVSRTSIYRYIYDEDRPNEDTMLRICRVLDIKFEEGLSQYTPKKTGRPFGSDTTHKVRTR